jgi:hypothetical protein
VQYIRHIRLKSGLFFREVINARQPAAHAVRAPIKLLTVNDREYVPALTDNKSAIREIFQELREGYGLVECDTLDAVRSDLAARASLYFRARYAVSCRAHGPRDEITIFHTTPRTPSESGQQLMRFEIGYLGSNRGSVNRAIHMLVREFSPTLRARVDHAI